MKPAFVKKNTAGGAGGITWEAGEVKPLNPRFAEELVMLSPEDFEIVKEGEASPKPPVHHHQGTDFMQIRSDGDDINFDRPSTSVVEVEIEGSQQEIETMAAKLTINTEAERAKKATRTTKKAKATSAE